MCKIDENFEDSRINWEILLEPDFRSNKINNEKKHILRKALNIVTASFQYTLKNNFQTQTTMY